MRVGKISQLNIRGSSDGCEVVFFYPQMTQMAEGDFVANGVGSLDGCEADVWGKKMLRGMGGRSRLCY